MAQTLPPELNQSVHLLISGHSLDALAPFAVELIDQHFDETSDVRDAAEGGRV